MISGNNNRNVSLQPVGIRFPYIETYFIFVGFDAQGAEQLGNKLHNTSKWIGATEIAVLLRSLGIR